MNDPIQSGKLRHPVTIERFVRTSTGDRGQPVGTWQQVYSSVWAEIVPLSGRQLEIARQMCATASHTITIRHHTDITPQMRVQFRDRYFNIESIDDGDMRLHYLILTTSEQKTGATNG